MLIAFWRLVIVSVVWNVYLWSTGRRVTTRDVRQALIPGIFFGLNLAIFFAGATNNSVANAALIGSLAPFLIVPLGAWLFRERIVPAALVFAVIAFGGLVLVLFSAPANGDASLKGNVFGVHRDVPLRRLHRVDPALPPRHGRLDVHGDDQPDRRGRGRSRSRSPKATSSR